MSVCDIDLTLGPIMLDFGNLFELCTLKDFWVLFFFYLFQVTEIEGRSALLKWGPPIRDPQGDGSMAKFEPLEHISESDFRYEVCLSDKGKDGKYR